MVACVLASLVLPAQAAEVLDFNSGLRVVLAPSEDANRVATSMVIGAGSLDEPEGREGVAHLVEHLWFDSHDDGGPTAWAALEGLGCTWAADTWAEYTRFGASCPRAAAQSLVALELRRVWRPLVGVEDAAIALGARTVAAEEVERTSPARFVGREILAALYPPDHPLVARGARPDHAAELGRDAVEAFAGQEYRPDQAVLAIAGDFDASALREWLSTTLGPPIVAPPARTALRSAPAHRRALRLAPRVLEAPLPHPLVSVAWSLPARDVGYFERELLADLTGRALWWRYRNDPRVVELGCFDDAQSLATPLICSVSLADDTAVEPFAEELRAGLDSFWSGASAAAIRDVFLAARSQTLVSLEAGAWRFGAQGSTADALALAVLLGGDPNTLAGVAKDVRTTTAEDILAAGREHLGAERALVVAWRATPDSATPLMLPGDPVPPIRAPAPTLEVPIVHPAVAEATLPNGVRVLAVQRAGAVVMAGALTRMPDAPRDGVSEVLLDRSSGVSSALLRDVVPWGGRRTAGVLEGVTGLDAPEVVLRRLLERLERRALHLDPREPWLQRRRVLAEREREDPRWWARTLPAAALDATGAARARAAMLDLDAMDAALMSPKLAERLAGFRPDRTEILIVGPEAPEVLLAAAADSLGRWRVTSPVVEAAPAPTTPPLELPNVVIVDAPDARTTVINWACPIDAPPAVRIVLAEVAEARVFDALRANTGWAYSPYAEARSYALVFDAEVPHDRVPAALAAIGALPARPVDPGLLERTRRAWLLEHAPAMATSGALTGLAFGRDGLRSAADLLAFTDQIAAVSADDLARAVSACGANARIALAGPADRLPIPGATVWTVEEAKRRVAVP